MMQSGFAAIAKVTMHNRENVVIIRARKEGFTLHTMFYQNEIRPAVQYGSTDKTEIKEQEMALAMQLINALAAHFKPEKYRDLYQQNLQTLIEAKAHGQKIELVHQPQATPVVDLMDALKKSLSKPAPVEQNAIRIVPKRAEQTKKRKTG
jgi:DNA end-binding protein Ku